MHYFDSIFSLWLNQDDTKVPAGRIIQNLLSLLSKIFSFFILIQPNEQISYNLAIFLHQISLYLSILYIISIFKTKQSYTLPSAFSDQPMILKFFLSHSQNTFEILILIFSTNKFPISIPIITLYQKQDHIITQMGNQQPHSNLSSNEVKDIYRMSALQLIHNHKLKPDLKKISKNVIKQLFQSFTRYTKYSWSQEIVPVFLSTFEDYLNALWMSDKERFYRQMLENTGLINTDKKIQNYQNQFYSSSSLKGNQHMDQESIDQIQSKIQAINNTIIDQSEVIPFVIKKNKKNKLNVNRSCIGLENAYYKIDNEIKYNSEYYDTEILRSSVIVPETVFVQRLNDEEKENVNSMLDFYKGFSQSLQQMVRSVSLVACPLKHFEIMLKKKVKVKKIKYMNSSSPMLKDTRQAALFRKKQQFNNSFLLFQIKDFTDAYTEFVWKFFNLHRVIQTEYSNFITIETAYGVVLKIVWTFTSWIGQRGYEWQQRQISQALKLLSDQQKQIESKQKKKSKKVQINLDQQIVKKGCNLSLETNPQKYLKQIVIIYRELSKKCSSADELIIFYQALFQQMARRNSCQRLFRMQSIIQKLLKMQDSCGEICYAWTTWNIMVQTVKKAIQLDSKQKEVEEDFKKYLDKLQKSRLYTC